MSYIDDYARQINKSILDDTRTNEEIIAEIKEGDTSLYEVLFFKNLGWIYKVLKPYFAFYSEDELFQESYLALYDSVGKFDADRGAYTHYLRLRITGRIQKLNKDSHNVSYGVLVDIRKYKQAREKLEQSTGKTPTVSEIAQHLQWSIKQVQEIQLLSFDCQSLDSIIGGTEDLLLSETLEDAAQEKMIDGVIDNQFMSEIWERVENIVDKTEKQILFLLLDVGLSHKTVSHQLGLTIRDVKRIKEAGLHKLRKSEEFTRFMEKKESFFSGSFLFGDSFSSFKKMGNSRVEESVIKNLQLEDQHEQKQKIIDTNYSLKINRLRK